MEKIFALAKELTPEAQSFGLIYNTSEDNSLSVIAQVKGYLEGAGLSYTEGAVTTSKTHSILLMIRRQATEETKVASLGPYWEISTPMALAVSPLMTMALSRSTSAGGGAAAGPGGRGAGGPGHRPVADPAGGAAHPGGHRHHDPAPGTPGCR